MRRRGEPWCRCHRVIPDASTAQSCSDDRPSRGRYEYFLVAAAAWGSLAQAQGTDTLSTIVVEGAQQVPGELSLSPKSSPAPAADAGEWLRRLNGVEGIRMGGHGLDPVIRGQQGNALNVLIDGGYVFGGCPNRMDPPTAYAPLHSIDRVTVSKGVTTLQHGAGGSGGTVLFERSAPEFEGDAVGQQGSVGASYDDNGERVGLYANLEAGNQQGYLQVFGEHQNASDYEDGDGQRIHSGFETTSGGITLGLTPSENTELALGYEAVRERDVKFAGAGMDSPESDNDTVRLRLDHAFSDTLSMENRLQYTTIDHVAGCDYPPGRRLRRAGSLPGRAHHCQRGSAGGLLRGQRRCGLSVQ